MREYHISVTIRSDEGMVSIAERVARLAGALEDELGDAELDSVDIWRVSEDA